MAGTKTDDLPARSATSKNEDRPTADVVIAAITCCTKPVNPA
ncbi:MAG: hypothetical protein QM758_15400 [Armatimonas sp.]